MAVRIQSIEYWNDWPNSQDTTCDVVAISSHTWVTAEGQLVGAGEPRVVGTGSITALRPTIPEITLPSTSAGFDNQSARWTVSLHRTGKADALFTVCDSFPLPVSFEPTATWGEIRLFKQSNNNYVWRDNGGFNRTDTLSLINSRLSTLLPATTTTLGLVEVDTAPVDAAHPIAVGVNSSIIQNLLSSTDARLSFNYPGVFDANASPYNCVPNTGVDQTANWQAVLNAAGTYALTHGAALILASDGVYTLSSPLTQTSQYNAQLTLPYFSQTDQRGALTIQSKTGTHNPTPYRYPGAPLPTSGVIFYSTLTPSYSVTYGKPFILAGPDAINGTSASLINYTSLHLKGVAFRTVGNGYIGGVNCEMLNRAIIEDCRWDTTDPNLGLVNYGGSLLTATVPTRPTNLACLMPVNGMDGTEYRGFNEFTGWYAAAGIGELTNIAGVISATQNTVGLNIQTPFYHGASLGHSILTRNKYGIAQVDASSGLVAPQGLTNTGLTEIRAHLIDFEDYGTGAWTTVANIYDPNSALVGVIPYVLVSATGGGSLFGKLTMNGGARLQTVNQAQPGTIFQTGDQAAGFIVNNSSAGTSAQAYVGAAADQAQAFLQAFSLANSQTELAGKVGLGATASNGLVIYNATNNDITFYTNGTASGNKRFAINIGGIHIQPITYANLTGLHTPAIGDMAVVSDSNTNVWGAAIAGGGANQVLAFYGGANWTVAAK